MSTQRTKRRRIQRMFQDLVQDAERNEESVGNNSHSGLNLHNHDMDSLGSSESSLSSDSEDSLELESGYEVSEKSECGLSEQLALWAVQHNVTSTAVDHLLVILKANNTHSDMPNCSKTLLKTPLVYNLQEIKGGKYFHFGIRKQLEFYAQLNSFRPISDIIEFNVSIDGLPVSRSSKKQFWPILMSSDVLNHKSPFLVGLYFSNFSKPTSAQEFLRDYTGNIHFCN